MEILMVQFSGVFKIWQRGA